MAVRSNQELNFFRIRAASTPVVHNIFGSIPNKGTIPLASSISQIASITVTSTPTTSTGNDNKRTVYASENVENKGFQPGDYLYAADVVRKIEDIRGKKIILEYPLPANISAVALKIVKPGKFKKITAVNTGTGTPVLQETVLVASGRVELENPMGLAPVAYDCSTAGMAIDFDLSE